MRHLFSDFDTMAANFAARDVRVPARLALPVEWCVVLWLAVLGEWGIAASGFVFPSLAWSFCGNLLVLLAGKQGCQWLQNNTRAVSPRYAPVLAVFFVGWEYSILCLALMDAIGVLSYLCCSWNAPLIDPSLIAIDRALGVDRSRLFALLLREPLGAILNAAYDSFGLQVIFFFVWYSCLLKKDRLQEIFWIFLLCMLVTVIVFGCLPALGPASTRGLVAATAQEQLLSLQDMQTLRAGASGNGAVVIASLHGLVFFPSFHTIAAIIYCYAFRQSGFLRFLIVPLNAVMLLSTLVIGNHYLIDMVAGAAIAMMAIATVSGINRQRAGEGNPVTRFRHIPSSAGTTVVPAMP